MAVVETIFLRLKTRDAPYAGTDTDVFLGIGGREFPIDSDRDDFERGDDRTYILGDKPNVLPENPEYIGDTFYGAGDPEEPYVVKTEKLNLFPVYIRVEPTDDSSSWQLDYVEVRVNPETDNIIYSALEDVDEYIFLGYEGHILYLLPQSIIIPVDKENQNRKQRRL
jgi:hypothetical protein